MDDDTVFAPKVIKKLPKIVHTREGDITKLEVQVIGKPKPESKWLKNDEEIHPSNEYQIENYTDGTSVLIISNIYSDDTGKITFEAQNSLGVAETVTELRVQGILLSCKLKRFIQILYIFINFLFQIVTQFITTKKKKKFHFQQSLYIFLKTLNRYKHNTCIHIKNKCIYLSA